MYMHIFQSIPICLFHVIHLWLHAWFYNYLFPDFSWSTARILLITTTWLITIEHLPSTSHCKHLSLSLPTLQSYDNVLPRPIRIGCLPRAGIRLHRAFETMGSHAQICSFPAEEIKPICGLITPLRLEHRSAMCFMHFFFLCWARCEAGAGAGA